MYRPLSGICHDESRAGSRVATEAQAEADAGAGAGVGAKVGTGAGAVEIQILEPNENQSLGTQAKASKTDPKMCSLLWLSSFLKTSCPLPHLCIRQEKPGGAGAAPSGH